MVEIDVKRLAINRISAISILYTLLIFVQKPNSWRQFSTRRNQPNRILLTDKMKFSEKFRSIEKFRLVENRLN